MKTSFNEFRMIKKACGKYAKSLPELLILTTLGEIEMSGFVHKTFETLFSSGTLYPMLNSLEYMKATSKIAFDKGGYMTCQI